MKILALEPYYGGSHRAFLDSWVLRSRHEWTGIELPPFKWKWRMRHAALYFAEQINQRLDGGESWDLLFTCSMLNLAEFKGLVPRLAEIPSIVYFHENQLTYPVRHEDERDFHYVMNHLMSCQAADQVWFNSAFHRDSFMDALPAFFKKMPDNAPEAVLNRLIQIAFIRHPGIEPVTPNSKEYGPLRIAWAARWEHDKNPEDLYTALKLLSKKGVEFRLNIMGEQFREIPEVFNTIQAEFKESIDTWGYCEKREDYLNVLQQSDIFISTAMHEFFGISAVEAIACGCYPLLPDRLAYPEVIGALGAEGDFLYDGSPQGLADALQLVSDPQQRNCDDFAQKADQQFSWDSLAPRYDDYLELIC